MGATEAGLGRRNSMVQSLLLWCAMELLPVKDYWPVCATQCLPVRLELLLLSKLPGVEEVLDTMMIIWELRG